MLTKLNQFRKKYPKLAFFFSLLIVLPLLFVVCVGIIFWHFEGRYSLTSKIPEICNTVLSSEIRDELCDGITGYQTVTQEIVYGLRIVRHSTYGPWQAVSSEEIYLEYNNNFIAKYALYTTNWNHGIYYGENAKLISAEDDEFIYFFFDAGKYTRNQQLFRFEKASGILKYAILETFPSSIDTEEEFPEFKSLYMAPYEKHTLYRYDFNNDGAIDSVGVVQLDKDGEPVLYADTTYTGNVSLCYENKSSCIKTAVNLNYVNQIEEVDSGWKFSTRNLYRIYKFEGDRAIFQSCMYLDPVQEAERNCRDGSLKIKPE